MMTRAALWLRVSTDNKGQDPALQRADLVRICEQRNWEIVQQYEVAESAFGQRPRQQFQAMLDHARQSKFDVLVVWSMDRFSREGEWSVSRVIDTLQTWRVQFFSFSEPFLDTPTPFAGILIPMFAWMARQESVRKGQAVRLGMEKARSAGVHIGRPTVQDKLNRDLVVRLREEDKSWSQIRAAHPYIVLSDGRRRKPSLSSIRRVALR